MNIFNQRIQEERKRLGLTQQQVADIAQITVQTQRLYENGKRTPKIEYLQALDTSGFDFGYIVSGQRKPDSELMGLSGVERGIEVSIRVIDAAHDLGINLGRDVTKEVCMYAYQHCPTEQGIKEYISSVYAIKGIEMEAQKRKDEQEFLDSMIEDTPVEEDELKDFDPMDSLWLGGDKNDRIIE